MIGLEGEKEGKKQVKAKEQRKKKVGN